MKFDNTKPVHVYRNLHKKCWSIKQGGLVVGHAKNLVLENCRFVVQPGGRAKVLLREQKNVHAYAAGMMSDKTTTELSDKYVGLHYNPYKFAYFYRLSDNSKIEYCTTAFFMEDGSVKALEK